MAGIAGWIDWGRNLKRDDEAAVLSRMLGAISHRGPDGGQLWVSSHAALGHCRLARIEGEQPLALSSPAASPCVLVFDGSLDNGKEVRGELERLGQRFDSDDDAEIILRGYFVKGRDIVELLGGMFAFAIWDEGRNELFAARDRVGLKPFYYSMSERSLLFASEPKGLLAHPDIEPALDELGVAELFALSFAHTPGNAIFRDVHELSPAHALVFGKNGLGIRRYWQLESRAHHEDIETTTRHIGYLFESAVERRLAKDACTLLSGGLDSSAITALAHRALDKAKTGPVDAYAVEMRGADSWFVPTEIQPDLDSVWAQKMADHLGARYEVLTLDAKDILDEFFAPLAARDLPSLGEMDASLYLLCREIKKRHDIVLSGESADEIFGGYPFFFDENAVSAETFPWLVQTIAYNPAELLRPEIRARIRPDEFLKERYREALAEVPRLDGESAKDARMREVFYLVQERFLPMLINRKDRMSMASSLQARMPFADHRLHEYLWNVPWEMKSLRGREKGILRKALEGIVPDDVLWRKKSAYPSMHDPAFTHAVHRMLEERLDDPNSPILALIDLALVREKLARESNTGGIGGESHLLAYLLQIDEWLRRYRVRIAL